MNSPVIVVGTITGVERSGRPREASKAKGVFLDPAVLSVSIEAILKGQVSTSEIRVYTFLFSLRNSRQLGQPVFSPEAGQRRIFWIRRQGVFYRTIYDVLDRYSIRVYSGRHSMLQMEPQDDPGRATATLLLTPGEGYNHRMWALRLQQYTYIAKEVAGEAYMKSLLARLKALPDKDIRRTCDELELAFEADLSLARIKKPPNERPCQARDR